MGEVEYMGGGDETTVPEYRSRIPSPCQPQVGQTDMELAAVPNVQVQAEVDPRVPRRRRALQQRITHSDHYVRWGCEK